MMKVQPITSACETRRSHSAGKRQFSRSSSSTFHVIEGGTPDPVTPQGKKIFRDPPFREIPLRLSKKIVQVESSKDDLHPEKTGVKRIVLPERKAELCIRSSIFPGYTNRSTF